MSDGGEYAIIAREVARRLRENDARGDESQLREMGARSIEQLCELVEAQKRLLARYRDEYERRFGT